MDTLKAIAQVIKSTDVNNVPQIQDPSSTLDTAVNLAFFIAGAVAVLFVIINAIRYIISQGDSKRVSEAKDGILYSLIGMILVSLAFAMVQVVIGVVQNT